MSDPKTYLSQRCQFVDSLLDHLIPPANTAPVTIHKAMRHSVFAGGKRLRPILCLAAAEAMAAGLPVVGTDTAGLNEVVAAGRTGILRPVGDAAGLAAAILALARDEESRAAMGSAGHARVGELFTIERFVREHAALYRELANR